MLLLEQFAWLQTQNDNQRTDIGIMANAGLSLGERTIRGPTKLTGERHRQLIAAQTRLLPSTGVFRDTPFQNKLTASIEGIDFDTAWADHYWKLQSARTDV